MSSIGRALGYGLLVWLIPFAVSFFIFPVRAANRPLFESIMPLAIAAVVVVLGVAYLRSVKAVRVREGVLLGVLWLAICVLIDAPLMLLGGPMKMSVGQYVADIGVTYLIIPTITAGLALAATRWPRTWDRR